MRNKIGKYTYKVLSSAIIYGSNASGKTNIIGAMDTFKNIVLRGHIRNDEKDYPNAASVALELIPNNTCKEAEPVEFSIKFIEQDIRRCAPAAKPRAIILCRGVPGSLSQCPLRAIFV